MLGRRGRHSAATRTPRHLGRLAVALLTVGAAVTSGATSGTAVAASTSGSGVLDYSQCQNDAPPSTRLDCSAWINGILNPNNSHYREGDVVPQRVLFTINPTSATQTHEIVLSWTTRKNGVHAFDSLATWNKTQKTASHCQGLDKVGCPNGAFSTIAIPDDPTPVQPLGPGAVGTAKTSDHMVPAGADRQLVLYGGTLASVSSVTHTNNTSSSGDADASLTVRFTAPASTKSQKLELLYGAHLAEAATWGAGEGASSISGGPYHNMLSTLDGASVGSKDNQIQSGAVLPAAPAALKVVKTPDAPAVDAGSAIGFTITVTNTGGTTAQNVTVNDPLPTGAGLSWTESPDNPQCSIAGGALSCAFGSLAPGATTAPVHITSPTAYGTPSPVSNTATASATGITPTTGTGTVTVRKPVLDITKTADASSVNAGSDALFTVTVQNTGDGTATGLAVSDPLPTLSGVSWSYVSGPSYCSVTGTAPSQNLTCSTASFAPNASFTVRVKATTSGASSGDLVNTATVTATNAPQDSSTATTTVKAPTFGFTKKADSQSVNAGDPIAFTLTASNAGPGTATAVTVSDALPTLTGVTWSISPAVSGCSLGAPGQTLTCTARDIPAGGSLVVRLVSATSSSTSGTLANTAYASGKNIPVTPASDTITVKAANVSFSKSTSTPVVSAGEKVRFTVSGTNNGTGDANGVTYSDTLPALGGSLRWTIESQTGSACSLPSTLPQVLSCSVGTLAPTKGYSVTVVADTGTSTPGTLPNTASLKGSNIPDQTASASISVLQPKIRTLKTADSAAVSSGDTVGFTVTAVNDGPGSALGVVISDPLPTSVAGTSWSISPTKAGCSITSGTLTCTVGTLAANGSFAVHVTSGTAASSSGTLSNTATTTATNAPSSQASASVVVSEPNLVLTKTADSTSVDAGGQIGFRVTLTNNGPGIARNVVLTDTPPSGNGVSWSLETTVPGCTPTTAVVTLTCSRTALGSGESIAVHLISQTSASSCGDYVNTATATASNASGTATSPTVTIKVVCRPKLELVKEPTCVGQGTVPPGGLMSYTLRFRNTGTGPATDATLVDTYDPTTQPVSTSGGTVAGGKVTWSSLSVPAGTESTRTLVVKVGLTPGTITNAATISDPAALAAASSSLTTQVTEAGATTRGKAWAVDIAGVAPLTLTEVGAVEASAPGAVQDDEFGAPDVAVPGLVDVKLLPQLSHSELSGGQAASLASSRVGKVDLLAGRVTATAVASASQSNASAFTAGSDGLGSTVTDLKVNGNPVASTPNSTTLVKDPVLGTIARLDIRSETSPNAALSGGAFSSSHETTALTLTVLVDLPVAKAGAVIRVGHAETAATYPSGLVCGTQLPSVSGEAFIASATGKLMGTTLAFEKEGDAVLSPLGGSDADGVASLAAGTAVVTGAGTTSTSGSLTPSPHSTSTASVADVSLLGGLVTAKALQVTATSSADGTTASTSLGTVFTELVVDGTAVTVPVKPNTVISVPADGGVLYLVLNEQVSSTLGGTDTSGTVNAIHALLFKNDALSAEVVVASAHSDAHTAS